MTGELKRTLGLFSLVAYGVGDILGAGIYVLIGKIAGLVGSGCWLSFLAALVVASLTGFTYAELGARFPRSAGESFYSLQAFRTPFFSYLIGFLVLMSGVISMAVVSQGFAGYVRALWPLVPPWAIVLSFFFVLTIVNFLGMKESSLTNVFCTAVEVFGILLVIAAGVKFFGRVNYLEITPPEGKDLPEAFFQGSVLAFYAFIGFEDMVKAAEESHEPEKLLPRAILLSILIVACLYVAAAVAAVSVVPAGELALSSAPLMLVVERGFPLIPRNLFTLIALFAVTNTALVNFVMGSRLLYGMAKEGLAPSFLAHVHPVRHTPDCAIVVVLLLALALALTGTLTVLAQSTSLFLLTVFFLMNLSLVILKLRRGESAPSFKVPILIPVLGALTSLYLAAYVDRQAFMTALVLLGIASVLFAGQLQHGPGRRLGHAG